MSKFISTLNAFWKLVRTKATCRKHVSIHVGKNIALVQVFIGYIITTLMRYYSYSLERCNTWFKLISDKAPKRNLSFTAIGHFLFYIVVNIGSSIKRTEQKSTQHNIVCTMKVCHKKFRFTTHSKLRIAITMLS